MQIRRIVNGIFTTPQASSILQLRSRGGRTVAASVADIGPSEQERIKKAQESSSFLKKEPKNFYYVGNLQWQQSKARIHSNGQKFFVSFFQKRNTFSFRASVLVDMN